MRLCAWPGSIHHLGNKRQACLTCSGRDLPTAFAGEDQARSLEAGPAVAPRDPRPQPLVGRVEIPPFYGQRSFNRILEIEQSAPRGAIAAFAMNLWLVFDSAVISIYKGLRQR